MAMDSARAHALLNSWTLHLQAERKSENTIRSYQTSVRAYLGWADGNGIDPDLDRAPVRAWLIDQLDGEDEPSSVKTRLAGLKRFSAWAAEEGEIPADELATVKPPKADTPVIPELSDEQIGALLQACTGKDFRDRRDEAIVRFMLETATRAGEVVAMELPDLDLKAGVGVVRRGKGGRGRRVPFGPQTGRAIDRYLRMRRAHKLADTPTLWLGERSRKLGYYGLYKTLGWRAEAAGITDFHPHVLRHTGAGRWLAAGGSEGGLMSVAGWSSRDMIDRYTRATSERRAADEARRLNLGDL